MDLLSHLPQLLGGLLDIMQNEGREVREAAGKALEVIPFPMFAPRPLTELSRTLSMLSCRDIMWSRIHPMRYETP